MQTVVMQRHYVWELPVRLYHWVNAAAVLALCATGYLIGRPMPIVEASEASFSYWFGTVRFVHFVAAFVFFTHRNVRSSGTNVSDALTADRVGSAPA